MRFGWVVAGLAAGGGVLYLGYRWLQKNKRGLAVSGVAESLGASEGLSETLGDFAQEGYLDVSQLDVGDYGAPGENFYPEPDQTIVDNGSDWAGTGPGSDEPQVETPNLIPSPDELGSATITTGELPLEQQRPDIADAIRRLAQFQVDHLDQSNWYTAGHTQHQAPLAEVLGFELASGFIAATDPIIFNSGQWGRRAPEMVDLFTLYYIQLNQSREAQSSTRAEWRRTHLLERDRFARGLFLVKAFDRSRVSPISEDLQAGLPPETSSSSSALTVGPRAAAPLARTIIRQPRIADKVRADSTLRPTIASRETGFMPSGGLTARALFQPRAPTARQTTSANQARIQPAPLRPRLGGLR